MEDDRSMLLTFARAVGTVQPRAFLLENVTGLMHGRLANHMEYVIMLMSHPSRLPRPGQAWRDHLGELRLLAPDSAPLEVSYQVAYVTVNAADFGVPQIRKRVFIVGFRRDLSVEWVPPKPTHSREALLSDQWLTGDYWVRHGVDSSGLPRPKSADRLPNLSVPQREPWETVRDALQGLPELGSRGAIDTQHVLVSGARCYRGHTGSDVDSPAKSLKAGVHGVGGGENMLRDRNGQIRYFTERECARLQTFPDSWVFHGSWSSITRQMGNAVPVKLATAVAQSLKATLSRERCSRDASQALAPPH